MKIKTLKEQEKEHLVKILKMTNWDLEKASRLLKIPISNLKRKIWKHDLTREKSGTD
jgi:transcriptional regulator of acetoin/glycerol metabolism